MPERPCGFISAAKKQKKLTYHHVLRFPREIVFLIIVFKRADEPTW